MKSGRCTGNSSASPAQTASSSRRRSDNSDKRATCPRCKAVFAALLAILEDAREPDRDLCPFCRRELKHIARRIVRDYLPRGFRGAPPETPAS